MCNDKQVHCIICGVLSCWVVKLSKNGESPTNFIFTKTVPQILLHLAKVDRSFPCSFLKACILFIMLTKISHPNLTVLIYKDCFEIQRAVNYNKSARNEKSCFCVQNQFFIQVTWGCSRPGWSLVERCPNPWWGG